MNVDNHEIHVSDRTLDVLVYISEFIAFRVSIKLKCPCHFLQDKCRTIDIVLCLPVGYHDEMIDVERRMMMMLH